MYLPPDAPEQLVSAMSSMMSEGSAATGDVLMNMIGSPMVRLCVFVVFNKREKGKKSTTVFFFLIANSECCCLFFIRLFMFQIA